MVDFTTAIIFQFECIAEFLTVFSVYYNPTSVFSDLFQFILDLHTHFKYVKKLSNEKYLDTRKLDENFLLIIKSRDTSNGKIGHFLAYLFADSIPFPYDIPCFDLALHFSFNQNKLWTNWRSNRALLYNKLSI